MQKELSCFDIDKRFVRIITSAHDLNESRLYLLHRNVPLKKQYEVACLFGTNIESVSDPEVDDCVTEEAQVFALMDLLSEAQCALSVRDFLCIVCEAELFGTCRRMGAWSIRLLEEHNALYGEN
jgi:hypothetical protein